MRDRADAFELVDHRVIGVGSLRGGEAMRDNFRAMFELEERFAIRVDDVLAARADALLFLGGNVAVSRASGGAFERIFLQLWRSAAPGFWSVGTWRGSREGGDYELPINAVLEMDDRDRLARADIYDSDQLDQARARFDELRVQPPPEGNR